MELRRGRTGLIRRYSCSLALAFAACALLAPAAAQAVAPTLDPLGQANRHITATWTLPTGSQALLLEVSASDLTEADGTFADLLYDEFDPIPTSPYTSPVQFSPGTYHVHVCGDPCTSPADFSATQQITIDPVDWPLAPPVLTSAGQSGRYLTATWTTGALLTDFIEAAASPATDEDGFFLPQSRVLGPELLPDDQRSYQSRLQLPAGTYWVHVAAYDPNCVGLTAFACDVFSKAETVTVPADAPPPPPPPPPADTVTSFSTLKCASRQKAAHLSVQVAMPENGTITVGGTLNVPNAAKVYKLKAVAVKALAGKVVTVRVKLPKKTLKAVKKALKRRKQVKANLTITARDAAGNTKTQKRSVKLKR
jgi:hypothetical protein